MRRQQGGRQLKSCRRLAGALIVTDAALYRADGMNVPVYRPSVPEDFWTPHLRAVAGSPPNRSAKSSAFIGSRKQK
jgi:hypothetical protein